MAAIMSFGTRVASMRIDFSAQSDTQNASDGRQQHALGNELANQPARRCTQCAANRHFASAAFSAHKQETRHIHAGDQEQQPRAAQHRKKDRVEYLRRLHRSTAA